MGKQAKLRAGRRVENNFTNFTPFLNFDVETLEYVNNKYSNVSLNSLTLDWEPHIFFMCHVVFPTNTKSTGLMFFGFKDTIDKYEYQAVIFWPNHMKKDQTKYKMLVELGMKKYDSLLYKAIYSDIEKLPEIDRVSINNIFFKFTEVKNKS